MRVYLFDLQGTLLDVVNVAAWEGASYPAAKFVGGDPCVQVTLLNWKNRPCKAVEIDHAGKLWKKTLEEPGANLEQMEWRVHLRKGRLQVVDASGKSIPE